jgi:hypothetical protein
MQLKKVPGKQPCHCGHGKTIHYVNHIKLSNKFHNYCRFPGCKCRDYKPSEKA